MTTTTPEVPATFFGALAHSTAQVPQATAASPAIVHLDRDGEVLPDIPPGTITGVKLVLETSDLTSYDNGDNTITTLMSSLASIPGVVPADLQRDKGDFINVPLLDADNVDELRVRWHVIDDLWVSHEEREDIGFRQLPGLRPLTCEWPTAEPQRPPKRWIVELTLPQAWTLVQILGSVQEWNLHLHAELRAAAAAYRRRLMAARRTTTDTSNSQQ